MAEPLQRAEFEFTVADQADVSLRFMRRRLGFRGRRWRTAAWSAVFVAAVSVALVVLVIPRNDAIFRVTVVAAATVLLPIRVFFRYEHLVRRNLERTLQHMHGTDPQRCEVELHA